MSTLPTTPHWLRAETSGAVTGVDREAGEAGIIRGVVLAQEGPFVDGRGEFDKKSLRSIVQIAKASPNGLKSRFAHPDESGDGIGRLVGRVKNPRIDTLGPRERDSKQVTEPVQAVRGDLHITPMALESPPNGGGMPYGEYVMGLAETDPGALSSSLVIGDDLEEEFRLDKHDRRKLDDNGHELPPIWRPNSIHASDIVDRGAAVDSFLSAGLEVGNLPNRVLWQAAHLLDAQFADQPRDVVDARCRAWLDRYLSNRFGEAQAEGAPDGARLRRLLVEPGLFVALCRDASDNPLPEDSEIVGASYDFDHAAILMTFRSGEWEPHATGSVVPMLVPPVLSEIQQCQTTVFPYDPDRDPDRLDRERRLANDDGS